MTSNRKLQGFGDQRTRAACCISRLPPPSVTYGLRARRLTTAKPTTAATATAAATPMATRLELTVGWSAELPGAAAVGSARVSLSLDWRASQTQRSIRAHLQLSPLLLHRRGPASNLRAQWEVSCLQSTCPARSSAAAGAHWEALVGGRRSRRTSRRRQGCAMRQSALPLLTPTTQAAVLPVRALRL